MIALLHRRRRRGDDAQTTNHFASNLRIRVYWYLIHLERERRTARGEEIDFLPDNSAENTVNKYMHFEQFLLSIEWNYKTIAKGKKCVVEYASRDFGVLPRRPVFFSSEWWSRVIWSSSTIFLLQSIAFDRGSIRVCSYMVRWQPSEQVWVKGSPIDPRGLGGRAHRAHRSMKRQTTH